MHTNNIALISAAGPLMMLLLLMRMMRMLVVDEAGFHKELRNMKKITTKEGSGYQKITQDGQITQHKAESSHWNFKHKPDSDI